jgi:hypothetical protein
MGSVAAQESAWAPGGSGDRDSWIVCRGLTRDVADGMVVCPLRGMVNVQVCRDCRFLETVPGEWRRWSCGLDER